MGSPSRKPGSVRGTLEWIEGVLDRLEVPRQYVGGLAARAHGATRPLLDIDLYVPDEALPDIAGAITEHLVRFPVPYQDESWDLVYLRADYHGQAVEIGGADTARYRDTGDGTWCDVEIDYDAGVCLEVEGVAVPVMPLEALAEYKAKLGREVDQRDLEELGHPEDEADGDDAPA